MEKNGRLSKEYKITPASNNFKVIFGVINRKNPSIIYLKINTWAKYLGDLKDYNEHIIDLNYEIRMKLKNELWASNLFDSSFFYTPNIKKTLNKSSSLFHACFEITLKRKDPKMTEIDLLSKNAENLTNKLIALIESNDNFEFNIKKEKI